jgi:hypothetical protein
MCTILVYLGLCYLSFSKLLMLNEVANCTILFLKQQEIWMLYRCRVEIDTHCTGLGWQVEASKTICFVIGTPQRGYYQHNIAPAFRVCNGRVSGRSPVWRV